ncbi:MAG: phage Gp37/Gp68 family protein [Hyphomonas sp.]|nr:phage Gp37/Gp68 family protein [Hyphomonas sp.]
MAEETRIEWADHTFNPWIGCTKVSPACDHCYAEAQASRYWKTEGLWSGNRKRTSANNWRQPLKWNRDAAAFREKHGRAPMVFCASLADVFDNQVPEDWRRDLWALIDATPRLTWLLLTKRPQNIRKMLPQDWMAPSEQGWHNVWFGTTVENQAEADRRIPALLSVPAAKRFLSCEPLLGPVDLTAIRRTQAECFMRPLDGRFNRIDWVIAGGESGREARPSHPDWFRSLRDQCAAAGVPFLFKQWGEWREAETGDSFDTGSGRAGKPPAFIVDPVDGTVHCYLPQRQDPRYRAMLRVGKKAAGRLLDGVLHDARPEV